MLKRLMRKMPRLSLSAGKGVVLGICSALIIGTCTGMTYATPCTVTIQETGKAPVEITTTSISVGKLLAKQGIVLAEDDQINYELGDVITNQSVIKIDRAFQVNLTYHGQTEVYKTVADTVAEVLENKGIVLDSEDEVTPSLETKIKENDHIVVVDHDLQHVTVQEKLPYQTIENENVDLAPGERVIVQKGIEGVIEYEYTFRYENGAEVDRQLVREIKLSDPVDEIVEYGPEDVFELGAIPASKPTRYSQVKTFQATAYDASPADNGIWAGKTSTGMPLVYGVVAVDPRVIPYGTKMYIESVDGQYIYGYAIAGDCGGAIKGNKVDLFFPSRSDCYQFGRRDVNIYFLD